MTPSSGWEQLLSLVTFHKMPAFKQEQQNAYPNGIACVLDPRVQPHGNSLFLRLFFAASLVGKFKAEGKEQGRLTNGSDFVSFEGGDARCGDVDSARHCICEPGRKGRHVKAPATQTVLRVPGRTTVLEGGGHLSSPKRAKLSQHCDRGEARRHQNSAR